MDASLAFVGAGAAFGTVLGSSLLGSRRAGMREEKLLALLLIAVSLAMLSITLQHGAFANPRGAGLELVEYVTALSAGPLFLGYVRRRARGEVGLRPAELLHFLPAAAIGVHIIATSSVAVPFRIVMLIQMVYTGMSVSEIVAARRRGVAMDTLRWPTRFAAFAVVVHVAQIVRTVGFGSTSLRNVVPVTAIAALEVLAILAFRESILGRRERDRPARERAKGDDESLLSSLDAAMRSERLWCEAGLNLDTLASAVRSTPHRVSAALNAARGGFFEYVSSFRLEAVREALENPENDRFTIDALAENAGFRSRSTFYSSFRKRFGFTPSELRRRHEVAPPPEPPGASQRASGVPGAPH